MHQLPFEIPESGKNSKVLSSMAGYVRKENSCERLAPTTDAAAMRIASKAYLNGP